MSSIRRENRLLADIVEANGGVVTNKDNRCKLLNDWLDSISISSFDGTVLMFGDTVLMFNDTILAFGEE